MSVYHTSAERAVYMHLKEGFYSKFFPNGPSLPSDGAIPEQSQPSFEARDPVVEVGHHPNGDHLHFEVADTSDRTFSEDTAGPGVPAAFSDFYLSRDSGESWNKVSLGIPVAGDVIAYYPWSPWSNKGDPLSVAPAVACFGNNHLVVFAKGENDRLWQKTWDGNSWNGDEWSEWRDLGGILTSAPAVASWGPNRLHVFARWEDGHLRHKRWNGKEWSEWRDRGGRLTSAPGAVSWGPNRIDVFVRGHDYQLAHMYWSEGGWSEWRDLDHD